MPSLNEVFVPHLGREFRFQDRTETQPFVGRSARMPGRAGWTPPVTNLPVDSTGDAKVVCPIYGNSTYGDCGEAMAAHWYQILKFRQGKGQQYNFDVNALIQQYLAVAGGDNGLYEQQVTGTILKQGVGGVKDAVIVDALDVDLTDVSLIRFLIDQFYTVQMGWSVPNSFISNFAPGSVWASPGRPNPLHGHYTPLADVGGPKTPIPTPADPTGGGRTPYRADWWAGEEGPANATVTSLAGFYRLYTWGAWAWVSPAFVASVRPDGFVVFSAAQFDAKTGLDSKGRHVRHQADLWVACGGKAIPESVLAAFPAPVAKPVVDWGSWD